MTRAEHLQWSKDRALEYADKGDITNAMASMSSDLRKHPELVDHAAIELGMMLWLGGHMNTIDEVRKFINGFN